MEWSSILQSALTFWDLLMGVGGGGAAGSEGFYLYID